MAPVYADPEHSAAKMAAMGVEQTGTSELARN